MRPLRILERGRYRAGRSEYRSFYFGSDRHRYELFYKGQGRLIVAGGAVGDLLLKPLDFDHLQCQGRRLPISIYPKS